MIQLVCPQMNYVDEYLIHAFVRQGCVYNLVPTLTSQEVDN